MPIDSYSPLPAGNVNRGQRLVDLEALRMMAQRSGVEAVGAETLGKIDPLSYLVALGEDRLRNLEPHLKVAIEFFRNRNPKTRLSLDTTDLDLLKGLTLSQDGDEIVGPGIQDINPADTAQAELPRSDSLLLYGDQWVLSSQLPLLKAAEEKVRKSILENAASVVNGSGAGGVLSKGSYAVAPSVAVTDLIKAQDNLQTTELKLADASDALSSAKNTKWQYKWIRVMALAAAALIAGTGVGFAIIGGITFLVGAAVTAVGAAVAVGGSRLKSSANKELKAARENFGGAKAEVREAQDNVIACVEIVQSGAVQVEVGSPADLLAVIRAEVDAARQELFNSYSGTALESLAPSGAAANQEWLHALARYDMERQGAREGASVEHTAGVRAALAEVAGEAQVGKIWPLIAQANTVVPAAQSELSSSGVGIQSL